VVACLVVRLIVALDGGKSNLSSAERSGDMLVAQSQDRDSREHHRDSGGAQQIGRGVRGRLLRKPATSAVVSVQHS
jgi:hypothetical protein